MSTYEFPSKSKDRAPSPSGPPAEPKQPNPIPSHWFAMPPQRFVKLDHIDHVLKRPDMYVGPNTCDAEDRFVVEGDRIIRKQVNVHGILLKMFDEILVNARDHSVRDESVSYIKVSVEDDSFTITNDGSTLPLEKNEHGIYIPELVFGHMLTGSNFDDETERTVGGRNGLGAKLANIWSTKFQITLSDGETVYSQTFTNNMKKIGKPRIRPAPATAKGKSYTKIASYPDLERLGLPGRIPDDMKALMHRRAFDIAATSRPIVKLGTKRVPCTSIEKYAKLIVSDVPHLTFESARWKVVVFPNSGTPPPRIGFVNGISTNDGTHMKHVLSQITKYIRDSMKRVALTPAMVTDSIGLIVDAVIVNPEFDNQQKETLKTPVARFGSTCTLPDDVLKKLMSKKFGLVEMLEAAATSKADAAIKRNDARKTRLNIPKLDDATLAGTSRSGECTLILCEGDSAKSLAIAGLSAVGRATFGVFPLRGKLVNVRENAAGSAKNQEIQFLKRILGLEHKKRYTSTTDLRYGRVLIMTDADADGSHIKGLLLNYFDSEFPGLLQAPGFIAEFVTPLVKVTKGSTVKSFFSMQEYDAWRTREPAPGTWTVKYYKGLGTSTSAEARDYFSALDRHVITFTDDPTRPDALSLAFSKKRADDRKSWIMDHDGSGRRYDVDELPISDFVNKDLINFSVADVRRSIPDSVDGLKPSQRKVMFGAFKKRLEKDVKVAQFSGYVSEVAAYHHGEVSLQGTIVGLARDFTGSNNLNLLVPSGQFGSRLAGGSDAASARYIFTRLAPAARLIFPARDDPVLEYLEDDGMSIEPVRYIPIVPMVLVNGATGIGTGFSSSVPNHSIHDVISAVRARIRGDPPKPIAPSYRGFTGEIEACDGGFVARGTYTAKPTLRGTVVRVTELAPVTWTSGYKTWLAGLESVSRLVDESTETTVDLEFLCSDASMVSHPGLRLETKLSTTNMTLINRDGKPQKFDSVHTIIEEHYAARRALYEKRKAYELKTLHQTIRDQSNKLRFVECVVDGRLIVHNRPIVDVQADMQELGIRDDPGLLAMSIRSLTKEKVEQLRAHVRELDHERQELENTTVDELWIRELEDLESRIV